jgi:phage repressor protein C with HTH and peptisase S24 domain
MASFIEAYQRIQFATNTRTQIELANILEIRQSSISDAKRRNSIPADWYLKLFEKFGLSPDWLRHGTGPMYLRTEQGYVPQELPAAGVMEEPAHYCDPAAKSTMVTVYSMQGQPGGADSAPELGAVGKLSLPSSFTGPDMVVLRMNAHNMGSTIQRGAYFGVNTSDVRPLSGSVFVLRDTHECLLVRRIFLDSDRECYLLRSDAEGHPESAVPAGELSDRIMGRVSWILQELA